VDCVTSVLKLYRGGTGRSLKKIPFATPAQARQKGKTPTKMNMEFEIVNSKNLSLF
jgi:hypothetical protein